MRVVIFWSMCHLSLGHEKKALLNSHCHKIYSYCEHFGFYTSTTSFTDHGSFLVIKIKFIYEYTKTNMYV